MANEDGLIAGSYRIDPSRPGPTLAGGMRAFTVIDRRDPAQHLIAVETRADLPARPRIALARSSAPVPHTVLPIDYGTGRDLQGKPGWYVICDGLPGSAVGANRPPWRESELMAHVLAPAAQALVGLGALGLTHRAINPDNLFRAGPRDPVTLGPFWAAPPASLQPALYEPPYVAACLPAGRGEGTLADDVYALGVTLLVLALGRTPLAGLEDADVLRRKIELGSFAALSADAVLPPLIGDLLRCMLAEDPEHRPSPALLLKPEQARARRVAARPARRAQTPLNLGGLQVWSARELALGLSLRPERGHMLLKAGEVERWLRRCLGDPQLGMRVEEVTRQADEQGADATRAQGLLLMRGIAVIDPLAPLVWRGMAVQPDGLGSAFVAAPPDTAAALEEIVLADAVAQFHGAGSRRPPPAGLREEQRDWQAWLSTRGPAGGRRRLIYGMNPMLTCQSPLLGGRPVVRVADLLPALDEAAANADRTRPPIDPHIAAFLAARLDSTLAGELGQMSSFAAAADRLAVLRLFGRLQVRQHPGALPGLAGWLMSCGFVALDDWRNIRTRESLKEKVAQAATQGRIDTMLELLDDDAARRADSAGAKAAAARVRELEVMLGDIAESGARRSQAADLLGHEIVAGIGLIASLGAALALALP